MTTGPLSANAAGAPSATTNAPAAAAARRPSLPGFMCPPYLKKGKTAAAFCQTCCGFGLETLLDAGPLQVLADERDRLEEDLGRARLQGADLDLRRPGVLQVVACDLLTGGVEHDEARRLAGARAAGERVAVPGEDRQVVRLAPPEDDRRGHALAGKLL